MTRVLALLLVLTTSAFVHAEPSVETTDIVSKYQEAAQKQQQAFKDVAMDVTMEATIPKLKKQGRLNALRRISNLGTITYKILGFSGDDTVKKEIMARYMTAEVDSAEKRSSDMAITSQNYNFKYKGMDEKEGRRVHVLELKPKSKKVGLFKGEIWIDPETYLPIREQGRFVKSPSIFIKKMEFVRNYEIRDGVAYLTHMESKTDTRIVGMAQLNIDYANYHNETPAEQAVEAANGR